MENIAILKEEYEKENYSPIVKKEEDIVPKLEDNNHTHAYQTRSQNDQIIAPWSTNCVRFDPSPLVWPGYFTNFVHLQHNYTVKPFKVIRKSTNEEHLNNISYYESYKQINQDDKFINVKTEQPERNKKQNQTKFCKNYVGLLCSGFARTVLTNKYGSQITNFIKDTLTQKKLNFPSLRNQDDARLVDSFRNHIHKLMCGKKIRKANKERDFKIRNTRDLQKLWKILDKDSELTRLKKEVLREVMEYFFESDYYAEWLSNGMMSLENRTFFVSNKVEIQNKFLYPGVYKPKFNRT